MSHACVIVNVGKIADLVEQGFAEEGKMPTVATLEGRTVAVETGPLVDLLEPYNENTEVPRYRDYKTPREKAYDIQSVSKNWETYKATLDRRFTEPPTPRERTGNNPRSVDQATWERYVAEHEMAWENIAALYSDEEVAAAYNAYWTREDSGDRLYVGKAPDDRHTALYRWSTYNPQSKWDYWQVIEEAWPMKNGDEKKPIALASEIDWDVLFKGDHLPGFAFVDEAEGWVENGRLIWFGMSTDGDKSEDAWRQRFRTWVDNLPASAVMVAVDYHI